MFRQNRRVAKRLVLASQSPRRKKLLLQLGVDFDVSVPAIDESLQPDESPQDYVLRISTAKAEAVIGDVVLGADTCVVLDGKIFVKPSDLVQASVMLKELSGKAHQVLTGIAVRCDGKLLNEFATTDVEFVDLNQAAIDWYLALGESLDKAGGYALQGAAGVFVKAIHGSHSNVIGLPLVETAYLLREAGIDVMSEERSALR